MLAISPLRRAFLRALRDSLNGGQPNTPKVTASEVPDGVIGHISLFAESMVAGFCVCIAPAPPTDADQIERATSIIFT
jgi:hypothetical protein